MQSPTADEAQNREVAPTQDVCMLDSQREEDKQDNNDYYPETEDDSSLRTNDLDIPDEPLHDPRLQAFRRQLVNIARRVKQ